LSKIKQLSKETVFYGLSTILGRMLNFILVPFYTNIFEPTEYGYVPLLYAYIAVLNIVFIYGLDSSYLKFAGQKENRENPSVFSTAFISILVTSLLYVGILIGFGSFWAGAIGLPEQHHDLILWSALTLMFDALANIPFIYLRLHNRPLRFSLNKILFVVVNIILNILFIVYWGWGIEAVFISNAIASLISLLMVLPEVRKSISLKFDPDLFKRMMKFGLPYLPAGIAVMFMQVIDRPIMESLTDSATVGIYQANFRLGVFMMLYVNMFQYAWQPFFLQNAEEENAKQMFAKIFTYFTLVGVLILLLVSLFISDLAMFQLAGKSFIGPKYWAGLDIVPLILLGFLFNGFYINFSAGIYIKEKSTIVPIIMVSGAITTVLGNYLLIPVFGMMGSAATVTIAYGLIAFLFYIVTQRIYKIPYDYKTLGLIFLSLTTVAILYYGFMNMFQEWLLFYKLFLVLIFVAQLFLFKVFSPGEIEFIRKTLLRRK